VGKLKEVETKKQDAALVKRDVAEIVPVIQNGTIDSVAQIEEYADAGERIYLGRVSYKPAANQSKCWVVPLVRSGNVRDKIPSNYENASKELYLWICELAADVTADDNCIFAGSEAIDAARGTIVFVFENAMWKNALQLAYRRKTAISIQATNLEQFTKKAGPKKGERHQAWRYERPTIGKLPFNILTTDVDALDLDDLDADSIDALVAQADAAKTNRDLNAKDGIEDSPVQ